METARLAILLLTVRDGRNTPMMVRLLFKQKRVSADTCKYKASYDCNHAHSPQPALQSPNSLLRYIVFSRQAQFRLIVLVLIGNRVVMPSLASTRPEIHKVKLVVLRKKLLLNSGVAEFEGQSACLGCYSCP